MTESKPSVRYAADQVGEFVDYTNGILALTSPGAYAPGAPVHFTLELNPALVLEGKSVGSKRQPEGHFLVRMRLINLRREARLVLEAL